MIFKNISKSKLTLAFFSLVITFFVWQQGLRDSLNRPSVSFDISQKEQEIAELSVQSIPVNLKKFFIINDPVDQISKSLSQVSFEDLSEFGLYKLLLDFFSISSIRNLKFFFSKSLDIFLYIK